MGMGQTIIFAVLPPLARELGLPDFQVLSIFMISALWWTLIGPIWGRMSDRFGRRRFIIAGFGAYAISMVLFATTLNAGLKGGLSGLFLYVVLISTRSIYGLFGSASPGAAQAYIADRTPPAERTKGMAAFAAAFGAGAMIGPVFAGVFSAFGAVAPLYAVALLAGASALMVFRFLPERTPPKERAPRPKLSPFDPRIRSHLIFGVATGLATAIPVQFISFYLIDRGISPADAALQSSSIVLAASAGASLFSQLVLVQRFKLQSADLLRFGPIALLVGHLLVAIAPGATAGIGVVFAGMLLSGLGAGLILPGYVSGASLSVSQKEQGAAAGLSNAAGASGFILAPLAGTAVYTLSPQALFIATAGIGAGCALFAFLNKRLSLKQ